MAAVFSNKTALLEGVHVRICSLSIWLKYLSIIVSEDSVIFYL
jgi:hypothetical protein